MLNDTYQKYIFLDIDGVLNGNKSRAKNPYGHPGLDKTKMRYLKQIVITTDARLVLISDWRLSFLNGDPFGKMSAYITKRLSEVGLTFDLVSEDRRYRKRGDDIRTYIREHPCNGFVILDDTDYDEYYDADLYPHYLQTDSKDGLQKEHITVAVKKLKLPVHLAEGN